MTAETPAIARKTLVTMLLDGSPSMDEILPETIDAVNGSLKKLGESSGDMMLTIRKFHSVGRFNGARTETLREAAAPRDISPITIGEYGLSGWTPLYDAILTTVRAIEQTVADRPDISVCLVIQTDGKNNDSCASADEVRRVIAEKTAQGWEINFLGCGIDAYADQERTGLDAAKTVSYGTGSNEIRHALLATAENIAAYSEGRMQSTAYSAHQKLMSGDVR